MASEKTYVFPTRFARRIPDPVFADSPKIERHIYFVRVGDVPAGLPLDPNARVPKIRRRVYREIEKSLLDQETTPGTFHLKHKGITVIASAVEKRDDETYLVTLGDGENHGIVDGGHTYELIMKNQGDELPENQFVKFEILTGVPQAWIVDVAGGLNTSVQVQQFALDDLAKLFDWIKDELRDAPYFEKIAWRENEGGDFDARDIVSLLTLFNTDLFPNSTDVQPIVAYERKSKALESFEQNPDSYKRLRPILKNILELHDTIRLESQRHWNETGGKFGKLAFVESKRRGEFEFPFTGEAGKYRLMNGALYPMLGAFRWMVEDDPRSKNVRWRGGFRKVVGRWETSAAELMRATAQASTELGRNPNAIGKSRNHWSNLHARVAFRDLQAKMEAAMQ